MKINKHRILGCTPYIELFIRYIYYSNNIYIRNIASGLSSKFNRTNKNKKLHSDKEAIFHYINELGIKEGDIVILHSSQESINSVGINPLELMKYIRELLGTEGTLVLPAFPLYNDVNYDSEKKKYIYKPSKTMCQTGMLPNLFLRMPGVVRSLFPWNTLAAQGPAAELMMKNNLDTDLAHGKGSAWEYCYNCHAKILLIGVRASHTTSMVHTAEDLLDDRWPIDNWYEEKEIYIESKEYTGPFKFRIRKAEWAKYNASWYRSEEFKKNGILKENIVEGLNIGYIADSKKMVDYIIQRTIYRKGFFVVPKRYYKK